MVGLGGSGGGLAGEPADAEAPPILGPAVSVVLKKRVNHTNILLLSNTRNNLLSKNYFKYLKLELGDF